MSRQASIPIDLEPAILRRWVEGASPRAIHRWIEESNANRKTPVVTSVSSVLRCIERAATRNSTLSCMASVHRSRLRSSALMDQLEEVDEGYRAVATATEATGEAFVSQRVNARLRALGKLELSTHRQLKLAGVGTAFGHQLVADHQPILQEMAEDTAAEDQLEDAGLIPELKVRPLPTVLFPPSAWSPELQTALRRAQAGRQRTLSESEPLVSQPIVESNRSTSTAPPAEASSSEPAPPTSGPAQTTTTPAPPSGASATEAPRSRAQTVTPHSPPNPLVSPASAAPNRVASEAAPERSAATPVILAPGKAPGIAPPQPAFPRG